MTGRSGTALLALLCGGFGVFVLAGAGPDSSGPGALAAGRMPRIRPDYRDLTLPPNIAPLNFVLEEPGDRFEATVRGQAGEPIVVASGSGAVRIPVDEWHRLLRENEGGRISVEVAVRDGTWRRFDPIEHEVARDPIDPYVVYRDMNAIFMSYRKMTIRQRSLEDFRERIVVDSRSFDDGCVNCHTFFQGRPDLMLMQMRQDAKGYGFAMMLVRDGQITKVDTRTPNSLGLSAFSSWHPNGRLIAFSMNRVTQFFHGSAPEVREVADLDSDLAVYSLDEQTVSSNRRLAAKDRLETWPAWSTDGRHLYFCSAPLNWEDRYTAPPPGYKELRYDLMRIPYDTETGEWGELEVALSAHDVGLSITQPRPSPDGRFLLLSLCDRGTFPTFRPSSDLYLWEPSSGEVRPLECNSDEAESWHCWSSNGRWIVFTSKRDDTLFGRTYIAWVGPDGQTSRAFILPQEDPTFYDSCIHIHQCPELIRQPMPFRGDDFARGIRSDRWVKADLAATGATPPSGAMQESGTTRLDGMGRE
jgi:hypothetical protein